MQEDLRPTYHQRLPEYPLGGRGGKKPQHFSNTSKLSPSTAHFEGKKKT